MTNKRFFLLGLCILLTAPLSARSVFGTNLNQISWPEDWDGFSLKQKQRLAPYLLDELRLKRDAKQSRAFLKALNSERDAELQAYRAIAPIYLQNTPKSKRLERLLDLPGSLRSSVARNILLYYTGREEHVRKKRLAICRVPSHQRICEWELLSQEIELAAISEPLHTRNLRRILRLARPFLMYKDAWVPVPVQGLSRVCRNLYRIGLPLEAALLAERFTWKHPSAMARKLREEIPYFLAGAGDFESALRFSFGITKQPSVLVQNVRLDWMILGGKYNKALDYIRRLGPSHLAGARLSSYRDPFSGFPHSKDGLRLRSAMLLYLSGDVAASARALRRLSAIRGEIGGAPARHFARLRLAQILLTSEPDLAHKIAEDMSYLAQEKSWYVLEYYATVLDGWAQYFRKQYYRSLINFIKANSILKGRDRAFYLHYSHTLGLLAVRQKLSKRKNYAALILRIQKLLSQTPKSEALFVLRDWTPKGMGADFFRELALRHYHARNQNAEAVRFLLVERTWKRSFFEVGQNPGGVRGFQSSARWIRELSNFSGSRLYPKLRLQGSAYELLKREHARVSASLPSLTRLPKNQAYAFSFALAKKRHYYLLAPAKRSILVKKRRKRKLVRGLFWSRKTLSRQEYRNAARLCTHQSTTCASRHLAEFQKTIRRSKIRRLNLLYNPEDRLDLARLLLKDKPEVTPVYFSRLRILPAKASALRPQVYRPRGCKAWIPLDETRTRRFSLTMAYTSYRRPPRAIQLWPARLDRGRSKSGNNRPVYLRRFVCGKTSLRLWDMDRFSYPEGPGLVIHPAWAQEERLQYALSEFFAERGTALLSVSLASRPSVLASWLRGLPPSHVPLVRAFEKLYKIDRRSALILPGIAR